jgi:predicted Zn-ribbon and HTH transcriptional regulator
MPEGRDQPPRRPGQQPLNPKPLSSSSQPPSPPKPPQPAQPVKPVGPADSSGDDSSGLFEIDESGFCSQCHQTIAPNAQVCTHCGFDLILGVKRRTTINKDLEIGAPTAKQVIPDNELVCGDCGYTRRGLKDDAKCPECGKKSIITYRQWKTDRFMKKVDPAMKVVKTVGQLVDQALNDDGTKPYAPEPTKSKPGDPKCPDCGYALKGLKSDRCPECGLVLSKSVMNRIKRAPIYEQYERSAWITFIVATVVGGLLFLVSAWSAAKAAAAQLAGGPMPTASELLLVLSITVAVYWIAVFGGYFVIAYFIAGFVHTWKVTFLRISAVAMSFLGLATLIFAFVNLRGIPFGGVLRALLIWFILALLYRAVGRIEAREAGWSAAVASGFLTAIWFVLILL